MLLNVLRLWNIKLNHKVVNKRKRNIKHNSAMDDEGNRTFPKRR